MITRPVPAPASVGLQTYNGLAAGSETPVAKNLPANIQFDRTGRPPTTGLPGDTQGRGSWKVFIPLARAPKPGMIKKRDIITDDTGTRYQVTNPYWNSLGFAGRCEEMQT